MRLVIDKQFMLPALSVEPSVSKTHAFLARLIHIFLELGGRRRAIQNKRTRNRYPFMSALPASDMQLIHKMVSGNADAFSELYERYATSVYRFASHVALDSDIAKDVTQETFLFLMRSGHTYDSARGPLLNWLLGVTRNFARRAGRDCREQVDLEFEPALEPFNLFESLTRTEQIQSVRDAVRALPSAYREVVSLCEFEELEYQEAARILKCPVGTVRSRLHRARRMLLSKLQAFSCV